VGQHSKPIVHFVIQAPNLAQMYINMLRTFSDRWVIGETHSQMNQLHCYNSYSCGQVQHS